MNCERVTAAICNAVEIVCQASVEAYIDDMGGAAPNDLEVATIHYNSVCKVICDMGLREVSRTNMCHYYPIRN